MSASVGPFASRNASPLISCREVQQATQWAAALGPCWSVETWLDDQGGTVMGIVTPSSDRDPTFPENPPMVAWMVVQTAEGLELVDAISAEQVGVFPSLRHALATVRSTERSRTASLRGIPANDP
jgi:hypothetical protein